MLKRSPARSAIVLVGVLPLVAAMTGCAVAPGDESAEDVSGEVVGTSESALSTYCNDVLTTDSTSASYESQVLTLTNQKRAAGATCGTTTYAPAAALTLDDRLQCSARKHSKDMATNNFFSHTGSDGSTFDQRIKLAGYTFSVAAENIAAGYATPAAVVDGWMNSVGHCTNIMNPKLKNLGVGYVTSSTSTYKSYWTQDFGTSL